MVFCILDKYGVRDEKVMLGKDLRDFRLRSKTLFVNVAVDF